MQIDRMAPAAVLAVALATALSGCSSGSSGPATDGPLGGAARGGAALICAHVGQPVTFGDERFTNRGHRTVVLDHVGLRNPHGLRLLGVYVAPGVSWLVGQQRGWPPDGPLPPTWKHRKPVGGFRLAPGKSFNMVLGMTAITMPSGSTPGLVIDYQDSAGSYVVDDHLGMIIITRSPCH